MICSRCGTQNPGDAKFCAGCGAMLEAAVSQQPATRVYELGQNQSAEERFSEFFSKTKNAITNFFREIKTDKKKQIVLAGVAGVIAIIIIASIIGSFIGPEDRVMNAFMKSVNKGDVKALYTILPSEFVKEMKSDEDKREDAAEMLEQIMEQAEYENGKGKFRYKIEDKDKMSKSEVKDYQNRLEMMNILEDAKVTAGYELEVELIYKGKDGKEETTRNMRIYKINGRWCIDFFSF